ncbi:MAG: tetratricopeptide repeat protein, partial [Coleofasciculus sp. Co-bin14]|nr:tetratricopeptide repeat protein [Coleofasciculus sp. Co-bin14]
MRALYEQTEPDKPLGGRYKIISQLGAGGFGQTFLAEDLHLPDHPRCVVKHLKPQVSDPESLQTARRLFDMEARVLYQLGNHDQIPRLLAHFEENQEFYLAQELIEGEPLSKELVQDSPWPEVQVVLLLQDLLHVLTFVHQQNVIHRDIKPSNLIRRKSDNRIVLIDFGAVKQVTTQVINPQTGQTRTISIGTQGYTPREQLAGNPRYCSDVYAVGIVGIQTLTGIHPIHFREDPDTLEIRWRDRAPQVSPELAAILDQMVRYDCRVRYPTAVEALEALQSLPSAPTQFLQLPSQELQSSATAIEATGSGTDLPTQKWVPTEPLTQSQPTTQSTGSGSDLSTQKWVPTKPSAQSQPTTQSTGSGSDRSAGKMSPPELSAQSQPSASSTGSNIPLATSEPSLHSSESSTPMIAKPRLNQFIKPWSVLAALVAVGASFFLAKTVLSPERASQTANRTGVPTASSTTSPTEQPVLPTSSPAASPSASPTEISASPSPTSSTTPNPTASPAPKPTPSSPASSVAPKPTPSPTQKPTPSSPSSVSSPDVTKPSPAPAQPTPKSPPPEKEPSTAELLSEADRLRQAGQYQNAIAAYDQAIASKPDVAEAHWGRCYSLNSLKQQTEAIAACDKALELNPNYPEALWSKGVAFQQQQNYQEALKLYEQATALDPAFAEAWNNKGVTLLALDRPKPAFDAFEKATVLKPDFANA